MRTRHLHGRRQDSARRAPALATALAVVACLAPVAALAASPAAGPRPGARCTKPNARTRAKGVTLVCVRAGKKTVWHRAPSKTATASSLTPACASLIVRAFGTLSNLSGGGDMQSVMQSMMTCQKDTGKTALITASPFRLADVASITKFRSCVGHDYAEGSADGQVLNTNPAFEKFRSMKHYISPVADAAGDQTKVFAPFDGVVAEVVTDTGKTQNGGTFSNPGSQIHLVPTGNPAYDFTFMHIYGITVKAGDRVHAGQQVGYYQVAPEFAGHSSFDVAVAKYDPAALQQHVVRKVSFMTLLTPPVAASFAAAGLTPDTLVWPRAYRDAHPCQMGANGFFVGPTDAADSVTLTH